MIEALKDLTSQEFVKLQQEIDAEYKEGSTPKYRILKVKKEGAGKRVSIRFADGGQKDFIV